VEQAIRMPFSRLAPLKSGVNRPPKQKQQEPGLAPGSTRALSCSAIFTCLPIDVDALDAP